MLSGRWILVSCALCALACSQKDPGASDAGDGKDSDSSVEESAASVKDDYYPLVAGSMMTYRHSGDTTPWDDKTTVRAEGNAFITTGAPDPKGETSENTIIRSGTKILRSHKVEFKSGNTTPQGTVDYEPGFIRFDSAWVEADEGFAENITYKRIEKTASGNVIAQDDREHEWKVEKKNETVTVPAGEFKNCLRVRRTRVRGNPANASDDDDKVFWFCAGIGKVKELSEIGGSNEELVSCKIPGGSCP